MKLPSLASLVRGTTATFLRFPLAITGAVTGTVFGILLAGLSSTGQDIPYWYWNVLMTCYLGMLLQVAVVVFARQKEFIRWAVQLAGAAAAIGYYFSLPGHFSEIDVIRFLLFAIGLHLLIAFIPFTGKGEQNGFWQYNKALFLRILTAALYTNVLYIGLTLALFAVEKLFRVNIDMKVYQDLWLSLVGVFNTWYFLAGFPKAYATLEGKTDYPKGLKIFTQYVLLPILVLYLVILYAYLVKIVFTARWPEGWVSYLVLGFSVAGILSLLLMYPVRNEPGNKWIPVFSRFFYFALLPLLVLLCCAIGRRVNDYGITELRYFVLLLAAWLVFIALYFLVSRKKNIKLIPVSLCLLTFLSSFGPWGVFGVSRISQRSRWATLLEKNKILVEGKVVKSTGRVPFQDRKQISSVTSYLVDMHGYRVLQPYFAQNLDSLMKHTNAPVDTLLSLMNLSYVGPFDRMDDTTKADGLDYRVSDSTIVTDIRGYDCIIGNYLLPGSPRAYLFGEDSIYIRFYDLTHRLVIAYNTDSIVKMDMDSLFHTLQWKSNGSYNTLEQKDMTFYAAHGRCKCKLIFQDMSGSRLDSSYHMETGTMNIFVGRSNK